MPHASQTLVFKSTHKPSVKFEPKEGERHPVTNGFYLNRDFAEAMGVKSLDKVKEIEITVRVKK